MHYIWKETKENSWGITDFTRYKGIKKVHKLGICYICYTLLYNETTEGKTVSHTLH